MAQLKRNPFYQNLPLKSKIKLFTAIFFIFAPISILFVLSFRELPLLWYESLAWMAGSGIIAVSYAYTSIKNRKFIPATVFLNMLIIYILNTYFTSQGSSAGVVVRVNLQWLGFILTIVLGYIFFVSFIRGEGAKSIRLQTEISLAQELHTHLVPEISLTSSHIEVYGKSVSSNEVGGDLIDVVEKDGKLALFIADVSGHGVKAGVLMSMVKSSIRMKLFDSDDLASLLKDLNQIVCQMKTPEMFVTLACFQLDGKRWFDFAHHKQSQFSLAGHPPILHYTSRTKTINQLPNQHLPLGVLSDYSFSVETLNLSSGDLLVFLTDGLTEVENKTREQFGLERISRIVRSQADEPLPEIYNSIMSSVQAHGQQQDDQTLILARIR